MRAVIQRVSEASVTVDGQLIGQIRKGIVIFVGVTSTDGEEDVRWLAEKCGPASAGVDAGWITVTATYCAVP